jgi:hypothetical protein
MLVTRSVSNILDVEIRISNQIFGTFFYGIPDQFSVTGRKENLIIKNLI